MKLAVMQPYFFPYIGYWQLFNYVDRFVIYDNIEYTKKGWINRNRFLQDGKAVYMTVPLEKDSDYLDIKKRRISEEFWKRKILHQLSAAYKKAPYYEEIIRLVEEIYKVDNNNLFEFLQETIRMIVDVLDIDTELITSSDLDENPELRGQARVINTCKLCNADQYINPIGGVDLYDKEIFKKAGIDMFFLEPKLTPYKQFNDVFVPSLSIIDMLMFCGIKETKKNLDDFELV